ncbi:hypothetical protein [Desulfitobacterium chlororespirans]|uniref:Uncharacterized protein n=1 Tax=Desulfitobacterium chlororespirans DSM 11544 TaxID=1121395 RepID=A0A1M7T631_9FIRM|nr:hypothetical protein [Desulfitobacterium chlororespirans]SHN66166.1 hypothetical protein SAMN02745215_01626 [Desulfitobacterium chlororespirans DSM 11544]
MGKLTNADFYYGAVLSHLLTSNKEHRPSLIEDSEEKRVFMITTDKYSYILRTHKSEGKRDIKENASSWSFNLSVKIVQRLQSNFKNGILNVIALILVDSQKLSDSKIIYFTDKHLQAKGAYEQLPQSISFTVRKYANKNDYLLFIDKKKENAIPVKQNLNLENVEDFALILPTTSYTSPHI